MATVLSELPEVQEEVRQKRDFPQQKFQDEAEPLGLSSEQRILVPIVAGNESKTRVLLRYASSLSRRYSMKLTLVTAISDINVPDGYAAFARAEGIGDYYYLYIQSLSSAAFSKWEDLLESEGVEYDTLTYLGSMKDAISEAVKMKSVGLVIVRPEGSKKGIVNRILHPTFLGSIPFKASPESNTPVLVVS